MAVVLLAEDVDRNHVASAQSIFVLVVLLAEDVDRNRDIRADIQRKNLSSSSRRTWIEI